MANALLVFISILFLAAATQIFIRSVRKRVPTVPRTYSIRAWKLGRGYFVLAGALFFLFAFVQVVASVLVLIQVDGLG
ncbi:MAG: hypothetical protein NDI61_11710 [Bdellovibrionaceae bacterium]|nr:hypothetical protein [Pseudobdellovibrionaceae bacterium]